MVKHLPHHAKVKGLSLAIATWTVRDMAKKAKGGSTVVGHFIVDPDIKGSNPATARHQVKKWKN